MTEDQRDGPEDPHLFAFGDRGELIVHQRPPAVLSPPSAGEGDATSDDDHRLSRASGPARLYHQEVAGSDAQAGNVGAGAKELAARLQRQLVRKRNQLAGRGGIDRFTLPDGSVQMHGHDYFSLLFGTSLTSDRD